MVTLINYSLPSRCDCGAPVYVRGREAWCVDCGTVRWGQYDKSKHPRGADGRFGNDGKEAASPHTPPTAADTDKTVQRALSFLTAKEREEMPRIILQTNPPDGKEYIEGYHVPGYPAIYVGTWSPLWRDAAAGDKDAEIELASVMVHEATHVRGGDENAAYTAQIQALRKMGASELVVDGVEKAKRAVARGKK